MLPSIKRSLAVAALGAFLEAEAAHISSRSNPIAIPKSAPSDAGVPLESFVSYSFEFSSWPDFAGMSPAISQIVTTA